MIRWLAREELDTQKWDTCIEQSKQPMVYALSWYLDCVAPHWSALVEEREGRYHTVLPLPEDRRWGICYLKHPFFAQQLGFFSIEPQPRRLAFLEALRPHYRYVADYCFNTNDADFALPRGNATLQYTHYLDLSPGYSTLRANYRPDRRHRLRQAEKRGLPIVESSDLEPLLTMFRQTVAPQIPGGVGEPVYDLLRRLFLEIKQRELGTLYYALRADGKPGAGAWFVRWQGQIIYLFNAAYAEARHENGRTHVLDQVIRQHAQTPQYLDFESAQVPAIADFYSSFGAVAYPFWRWHENRLPLWINLPKRLLAALPRLR